MGLVKGFVALTLGLTLLTLAESCSPIPGFKFLGFEEIFYRAPLVLFGNDTRHVTVKDPEWVNRIDSIFQVHCVLRAPDDLSPPIEEYITIRRIDPRNTCESSPTEVGKNYIVFLKRTVNNSYEWSEVKDLHSAVYSGIEENLERAMNVCGYQNPTSVGGSCPKPLSDPSQCVTSGVCGIQVNLAFGQTFSGLMLVFVSLLISKQSMLLQRV